MLLRMRNVIVAPHSAFNTREAVERIVRTTVKNIRAFLDGAPRNVAAGPAAKRRKPDEGRRATAEPPVVERDGGD